MNDKTVYTHLTGDGVVATKACYLIAAYLTALAAGAATATLYDGENTTGDLLYILSAVASGEGKLEPPEPVYLKKGLYVNAGSNVSSILIVWRYA